MSKHKWGRLDKIVKKGSTEEVYSRKVKHKLATILNDSAHPLYSDSSRMEGNGRLQVLLAKTNQLQFSFVPSAISLFNRGFEHI